MTAVIIWLVFLGAVATSVSLSFVAAGFMTAIIIVALDAFKNTKALKVLKDDENPFVVVRDEDAYAIVICKDSYWQITYTPGVVEFDSGTMLRDTLMIGKVIVFNESTGKHVNGGSCWLVKKNKLNETAYDYCHSLLSDHYNLEKL